MQHTAHLTGKPRMNGFARAAMCIILAAILAGIVHQMLPSPGDERAPLKPGQTAPYVAAGEGIHRVDAGGNLRPVFLKGVNIGTTLPDTSLDVAGISYEVYYRWLKEIADMHANMIRVFTVMNPDFYRALSDFNASREEPLLLMQGAWVDDRLMGELRDAFDSDDLMLREFKQAVRGAVDAVHGVSAGSDRRGANVSRYVAGYVLGLEWDPYFVQATNDNRPERAGYQGEYLYTGRDAAAFEAFLCEVGDTLIAYEHQTYHEQHPVGFLNWGTTDPLAHPEEPFPEEDMVSLRTDAVLAREGFYGGLFAPFDVYPYYPEFMNVEPGLIKPSGGKVDSFSRYIAQLKQYYDIPLIIAEFGVPSARGRAHESAMGLHQGHLTEKEQGDAVAQMMRSIHAQGLAGGIIFIWQDEWFKRTWNVQSFNTQAHFSNVQSAEQHYGLLAVEPGDSMLCIVDGLADEWDTRPIYTGDGLQLSALSDERYVYLLLRGEGVEDEQLVIGLMVSDGRGNYAYEGVTFDRPVDFVIQLHGRDESRMLTAANYDLFYYDNAYRRGNIAPDPRFEQNNSGLFNQIQMLTSNPFTLWDGREHPILTLEAGKLRHGVADPESPDYDSLSDFCYGDGVVELRIPWQLLNILDPSACMAVDDLYQNEGVLLTRISAIAMGAARQIDPTPVSLADFELKGYASPSFHMRLKQSYFIVKDALEEIN